MQCAAAYRSPAASRGHAPAAAAKPSLAPPHRPQPPSAHPNLTHSPPCPTCYYYEPPSSSPRTPPHRPSRPSHVTRARAAPRRLAIAPPALRLGADRPPRGGNRGEGVGWTRDGGRGRGVDDSDEGAADTRGAAVMRREERGGHRCRRVDVGLAVEQQPRRLEVAVLGGLDQGGAAVLRTCAAGRREEGAGSWGWWPSGHVACAHTSCGRLLMHGCF